MTDKFKTDRKKF